MNKVLRIVFILLLLQPAGVQAQRLWSSVTMNRSSVYVGQPVEVSIKVYTSTWFTTGLDPGNIQVEGAFTEYFRPVSISIQDKGQTYPGVELIYHVFPYSDKDIVFPSLTITVESPPPGDFKGKPHTLKTAEKQITVKPVPPDFSADQWLVTTSLNVSDRWSENTGKIKVGDVLTRTITRTAYNTVPELIPPLEWDSIPGVNLYPSRSNVQKHNTPTYIYATRTETMRYLFTEEGEVTIPGKVLYWFHSSQQKLYKRTLGERTFTVAANPDLGLVNSIRDSLDAMMSAETEVAAETEDQELLIYGLTLPQLISAMALLAAVVWFLIILAKRLWKWERKASARYMASEKYYFRNFRKSIKSEQRADIANSMYLWLDKLDLKNPTVTELIERTGFQELTDEVNQLENEQLQKIHLRPVIWEKAREHFLQGNPPGEKQEWINP